jgi:1-acyl-sn-glycerol-3-phosphate acyltransferase
MASASIARPDARAAVRIGLRIGGLLLALAVALPLHGWWRLCRLPSPWPRLFLGTVGWIVGARRRTVGVPRRRDTVLLANHQSWIDILVLAGATGTAFVAKDDLARVPLIGWLCTLNGTVFVARGDRMGIADQIASVREALADGWAIALFPEGTTNNGRALLPFKPALLAVLDPPPPGLMLQPVLIDYGAATPDIVWGDESGQANALRVLGRAGGFSATLTFLDPFDPAETPGRKAIAAEARARMEAAWTSAHTRV